MYQVMVHRSRSRVTWVTGQVFNKL